MLLQKNALNSAVIFSSHFFFLSFYISMHKMPRYGIYMLIYLAICDP